MSASQSDISGPYIVWVNFGYNGWKPTSYKTLKETLQHETYGSEFVITRGPVEFIVAEKV